MNKNFSLAMVAALMLALSSSAQARTSAHDLPVQGVKSDTVKNALVKAKETQDLSPSARYAQEQTSGDVKDSLKPTVQPASSFIKVNRSSTVLMRPGRNESIPIALGQPNRLVTPFKNPQVVSTVLTGGRGKDCGEVCIRDSVVYITTDRDYPVTAFITEKGREDLAMSLTMIPEAIPPREVTLILPETELKKIRSSSMTRVVGNAEEAEMWEKGQPYIDLIKKTFRKIALGDVPQGYSLRDTRSSEPLPVCRQNGLRFDFRKGQVLEGANMDFYVGTAKNISDAPIEFIEQRCGGWRIAAVSAYPIKLLEPGEQTEVYVAVKHKEDISVETTRRPLIQRRLP